MARMSLTDRDVTHHQNYRGNSSNICLIIALLLLLSVFSTAHAQAEKYHRSTPKIFLDTWSYFNRQESSPVSMVYVQFSPGNVVFLKNSNYYFARYRLEVIVRDRKGNFVDQQSLTDTIRVSAYNSFNGDRLFQFAFHLVAGEYQLSARISDLNSKKQFLVENSLQVQPIHLESIGISGIGLAGESAGKPGPDDAQPCEMLAAYPRATYGLIHPKLVYHFEVYRGDLLKNSSKLAYEISYRNAEGKEKFIRRQSIPGGTNYFPVLESLNTEKIPAGKYDLIVKVTSPDHKFQLKREKAFYVYQNPLDLRFRSYKEILDELELFATNDEEKQLKNVPEHVRQNALVAFWKNYDPTPETEYNEVMDEFYYRLDFARKYYCRNRSKKKLTDRGIVFVRFGRPSKIIKQQDITNRVCFESWIYSNLSRQFLFQDEYGFGEYHLVQGYSDLY